MTSSPVPSKSLFGNGTSTMNFPQAIAAVIDGKCITKLEWEDHDAYGMLRDGKLMLHRDGQWFNWIVSDGDLIGGDWITI